MAGYKIARLGHSSHLPPEKEYIQSANLLLHPMSLSKKSVVELVELSTNKKRKAVLIGVSMDDLDKYSINTIFG